MVGSTDGTLNGNLFMPRVNSRGEILGEWYPSVQAEATADDSDKTFTVPADTEWEVMTIHVAYTSTADVGDRQMTVLYTDGSDNTVGEVRVGVVQAASLTRYYSFGQGLPNLTAFFDTDLVEVPLPKLILPAGYKVRVYDKSATAPSADDMIVRMMILSRSLAVS